MAVPIVRLPTVNEFHDTPDLGGVNALVRDLRDKDA